MAEIITQMPLPAESPQLSDSDVAWLADARECYNELGQSVMEPEAFDALCEAVPHANTVGWVVIRDAWTEQWVERFKPVEHVLGGQVLSVDEKDALENIRALSLPVLSALVRLSRVGHRSPSDTFGSHASINFSLDGFNRHADCGDGHTFLANPLVSNGGKMIYELGDDTASRQGQHLGSYEVEVSGRSLLVVGGQAVKNENDIDIDGSLLPPYRTVAHARAGQSDGWKPKDAPYGRVRLIAYAHHVRNSRQLPMPGRRRTSSAV